MTTIGMRIPTTIPIIEVAVLAGTVSVEARGRKKNTLASFLKSCQTYNII